MKQRKEQVGDNGGANTMPETVANQADNPTQDGIALSASSCSCPSESVEIGLSQSSNPIQENWDNLTNVSPSEVVADSRSQLEVLASSEICSNHKMDNESQFSSHPDSHPQCERLRQSQVSKIYWNGSLIDRILDSNDKMKLILENGKTVILGLKEFNDFIWGTQEQRQFS